MMSKKIKAYIEEHTICNENIFKDWETFLDLIYSEGGAIFGIQWYDYVKISDQDKSVGGGGYRDPDNPDYMFAETMLYEGGFENKSLDEIKQHITRVRTEGIHYEYPNSLISYDLIPAFDICE